MKFGKFCQIFLNFPKAHKNNWKLWTVLKYSIHAKNAFGINIMQFCCAEGELWIHITRTYKVEELLCTNAFAYLRKRQKPYAFLRKFCSILSNFGGLFKFFPKFVWKFLKLCRILVNLNILNSRNKKIL